jgi:subtilisin
MKRRFFVVILAISVMTTLPSAALASSGGSSSRYFVETGRSFWRGAMGARHVFESGFTADLSDLQLGIARLAGLKPVPVASFNILADTPIESVSPTPQTTPSQAVSWGIRTMLGDLGLQSTDGGIGMLIALLDTGADVTHPDLARRVIGCYDVADAAEGFIEGLCADQSGHGTHVAGILVADGGPEGTGAYGFAPAASLSVYRVCGASDGCYADDIAAAIVHAVDADANIVVLGMGGEESSPFIQDAVAYAAAHDVMVVAGAGNDGPYEDSIDWPARDPNVVAVAAIDNENAVADFSSRGLNAATTAGTADEGDIAFAAPGVNIESTYRDGGYAILSGTSMAAPHIAGLAALLWQSTAEHPAEATRAYLGTIAEDISDAGDDAATGIGMPVLIAQ